MTGYFCTAHRSISGSMWLNKLDAVLIKRGHVIEYVLMHNFVPQTGSVNFIISPATLVGYFVERRKDLSSDE